MIGIIVHEISLFPVGYVEKSYMRTMSFKEFLWANKYSAEMIHTFKEHFDNELLLPSLIYDKLNELFLHYIVVGGMLEAVKTYIGTGNAYDALQVQRRILEEYKDDIDKYSSRTMKEKVRECFESTPNQLENAFKFYLNYTVIS